MFHIPTVICGGGILGLLTAKELSEKCSSDDFALFEKSSYLGEGNTSRNSGVLHSGIYYETGSLKHKLCLEGNRMWKELAEELNIPINHCGKFIVATSEDELELLNELKEKAKKNEVKIEAIQNEKIEELKEFIHFRDGFFIPSTAVLDISSAIKILEDYLFKKNISVIKNDEILSVEKKGNLFILNTSLSGPISCDRFINVTGTDAIKIRKMLAKNDLNHYFVKGNYVKLNRSYYNQHLIYPIPQKNLKGLGVHTSFAADGIIRFGPDTEDVVEVDFRVDHSIVDKMYPEIIKIFKNISLDDLSPDYAGVRPKIIHNGKLHSDFWIQNDGMYFECCGIESPGLTAAPAIAKTLTQNL
ncbi:FAD-dependent oxidoreductase [Bacteriovoracaceae bacterium]|nr:FAD-dependent oxidoreductase [Bacteriovoracaceae bacterium]